MNNKYSALIFKAEWCKLSNQLLKKLLIIENEFPNITFKYLDIDKDDIGYDINSIPTIILLRNNEVFKVIIGLVLIKPLRTVFKKFYGVKK